MYDDAHSGDTATVLMKGGDANGQDQDYSGVIG